MSVPTGIGSTETRMGENSLVARLPPRHLRREPRTRAQATYIDDQVCPTMDAIRVAADAIEDLCTVEEWNLPTYHELLFIQCP